MISVSFSVSLSSGTARRGVRSQAGGTGDIEIVGLLCIRQKPSCCGAQVRKVAQSRSCGVISSISLTRPRLPGDGTGDPTGRPMDACGGIIGRNSTMEGRYYPISLIQS